MIRACPACATPGCTQHQPAQRNGSTWAWRKTRARILRRDHHACRLRLDGCTILATHVHHVTPVAHGGQDTDGNLIASCAACNQQVGALGGVGALP